MSNPFLLDFHSLIESADKIRQSKWGKKTYFVKNIHLNYTNICVNHCKFCAFAKNKGEDGSYFMTVDKAVNYVAEKGSDASEIHVVGGLHPDFALDYASDIVTELKKTFPDKTIKGFTAVEIDYFASCSGLSVGAVLERLKNAGLEMMPGGGAEIFNSSVRGKICPEKIPASRWLEIHETAHKVGITTNATMLYGHLESEEDKYRHLLMLRELQERTGGFTAFIPLSFQPDGTFLHGKKGATGIDDIKTVAAARVVLDNIPHIKAYWVMLGEKTAQIALRAGADDLDGTIVKENIARAAGGKTQSAMTVENIVGMVKSAGLIPVERDSFYREIKTYG
ncbi:MAG: aminofutalosine synthase MqnE [Deferribacterales bacterium]|nr:aminofutalosine synthase MqnE [Deferribacterales bacterium]